MFSLVLLVESFPQLLALCVLGSIGRAMSLPSASAMIVQQGKKYGMGSVMGLFTMAMSTGMVLGPVLGGNVMDSWGISMVFLVGALMELIGTGLFAWLTR
jgi:predicted MFS family arabinose efflux permease